MTSTAPRPAEGCCGVCGRYVGPGIECPYCEAPLEGRVTLRALRWVALLTAVVGLAILWHGAHRARPTLIPISALTPTMNGAQLRARGVVSRPPSSKTTPNRPRSFSFRMAEGELNVLVIPRGPALQSLLALDPPLRCGDPVEVAGRLVVTGPGDYRIYAHLMEATRKTTPDTD